MGVAARLVCTAHFTVTMASSGLLHFTRKTSYWAKAREILRGELDAIKAAGTWKSERVITSPQAAAIKVQGTEGKILNFCANNYLGLSVR